MAIIHCFTSAGSEVEVKDQKIQTEISETVAGQSMCKQGALYHHLQVYAEALFTHSNLWQLYYYGHSLLRVCVWKIDKLGKEFNDEDSQCRIRCYNTVNYNYIYNCDYSTRERVWEDCHNLFQWSFSVRATAFTVDFCCYFISKNWVSLDLVHSDFTFWSKPVCTFRVQYFIHCKQLPNIPSFFNAETMVWNDC